MGLTPYSRVDVPSYQGLKCLGVKRVSEMYMTSLVRVTPRYTVNGYRIALNELLFSLEEERAFSIWDSNLHI